MKDEKRYTEEPDCFKVFKKDQGHLEEDEIVSHPNPEKPESSDDAQKASSPNQGEEKQSAVEMMLFDLMERYAFINIDNRHLYYYYEKEGYWKLIPANLVDIELRLMLTTKWIKSINSASLNELYKWLLIETPSEANAIFNTGREYLNFKDRAYNWKTKETTKDRQCLYFSYALAVNYPKKQEPTGAFDSFMDDVFGSDKDTKREFSKFVGLSLSDIRNLKYIIHLYGQSNTGKSTALNAIKNVVGVKVCSSLSFSQLSQEFYLSSLHGCRINISGEISGVSTSKLDSLKSLSGNDSVAASHKFRDSFQFDNRCLLVFASNELPQINFMEMQSYMSRAIIYPFRNVVERSRWRLDFEAELHADVAGIIDFAIKGLERLEEDDYVINETDAMKRCKLDYIGQIDSFTLFCDKYVTAEPKEFTLSSDITKAYHAFCVRHEYEPLQPNQWPRVLKRQFRCAPKSKNISIDGDNLKKTVRGYKGITLSPKACELIQSDSTYNDFIGHQIMKEV